MDSLTLENFREAVRSLENNYTKPIIPKGYEIYDRNNYLNTSEIKKTYMACYLTGKLWVKYG